MNGFVAVTGGAGFIGQAIVRALTDAGHEVRVLDLAPVPGLPRVSSAHVDVRSFEQVAEATAGAEAVYHLAGPVAGAFRNDPGRASILQQTGTAAVLEACRQHQIRRLVMASSFYVYSGCRPEQTVDEITRLDLGATDLFGAAKLAAERLADGYADRYEIAATKLRFGSVYGPGRCSNAVAGFTDDALAGRPVVVWGDPQRRNQFTHLHDIAAAAVTALTSDPGTYNLINPEVTTNGELAQAVAAATGARFRVDPDRPSGPQFPFMRSERATDALGWRPRDLATGLRELIEDRAAA